MNKCVFIPYDINKSTHLKYTIQNRVAVAKFENGGGGFWSAWGAFGHFYFVCGKFTCMSKTTNLIPAGGLEPPKPPPLDPRLTGPCGWCCEAV